MLDSVASQAIAREESVLVIDPKGERDCRDSLKRRCEAVGQPERFVVFQPGDPADSIRISPLAHFTRGVELAIRIAGLNTSAEVEDDPFSCFATMMLASIINGMLLVGETPSLVAINRYLGDGVEDLVESAVTMWSQRHVVVNWQTETQAYIGHVTSGEARAHALARFYREQVRQHAPSPDIDNLLNFYEHDREHMQKMAASLMPVLSALTDGDIGPLLSPDPNDASDPRQIGDLARLVDSGSVFYIALDALPDRGVGAAIGSLMLADLAAFVRHRQRASQPSAPINVLVEYDAGTVNAAMVRSLDKARAAGVRVRLDA